MFFLLLFTVVMGSAHYYVWRRAVRNTTAPGRARRIGTAAVAGLFGLMIAGLVLETPVLSWPGYIWLACVFYLAVVFGVLEIPRLVLNRTTRRKVPVAVGAPDAEVPTEPESPDRRLFIARSLAVAGGVATAGIVGYGATQALGAPRIKTIPVNLTKLDRRLAGYRIAVVSDIHLGPLLGRGHTERLVRMINEQQPDLVAIVGDLVDGTVEQLGEAAAPLRDLVSTHGAYFVTGNHEYYSGFEPWLAELDRLEVHPLRNERVRIERAGASFELAGVNDVTGATFQDGPDFARALDGRDPASPVVLLAHQPVQAHQAAKHGVDLQLSGHTHGGQMFPFHLAVGLQQPVRSGLEVVDGVQVYTTNGAGFWGPPVRVGAPPDISLVELHHNFASR
ncbi:metallophosphoesterase [Actinosynnema sp. CA-248983]